MRVAVIKDGVVINVEVCAQLPIVSGCTCMESQIANIGDSFDGEDIIPQETVVHSPPNYRFHAQDLLSKSDSTILRCVENSVPIPNSWVTYREELREVITSGVGPLPIKPTYPSGT